MISWKKLAFIGLPIIVSCYYLSGRSLNTSSEVVMTNPLVSSSRPTSIPVKKLLKKDEVKVSQAAARHQESLSEADGVFNDSSEEEEGINWKVLIKEWHETLKYHLSTLNEEKAEELFNLFMDEKSDFDRTAKHLGQKQHSLIIYDEADDMIGVKDQKMLEETTQQLQRLHNSHVSKVKKIFGPYYSSICELRRNFESGIPAQTRILIDPAFTGE